MKTHKLIIIGSGPAGLASANFSHFHSDDVVILEKNSSAGKKLLISGTGQCNLTNGIEIKYFLDKYGPHKRFVRTALYNFTNEDLIDYFSERGLVLLRMPNQKIFPKSLKSKDVLNVLLNECKSKGIKIKYNEEVIEVNKINNQFKVVTKSQDYITNNLIIATGGKSYPRTGSSGDGYIFATSLGHKLTQTAPALTPIKIKNYLYKECAGISIKQARLIHYRNNKKIDNTQGDLLFTHEGLSGPIILDYSRYLKNGDILKLNLVDYKSIELFDKEIVNKLNGPRKKVKNLLAEYEIPERLLSQILKASQIDSDKYSSEISKLERKIFVQNLFELSFEIQNLGNYKQAMVTKGGVCLDEINPKTMQSRIHDGLFFSGEVIDVDGDTGGFNIQFAFSSASLIATYLNEH